MVGRASGKEIFNLDFGFRLRNRDDCVENGSRVPTGPPTLALSSLICFPLGPDEKRLTLLITTVFSADSARQGRLFDQEDSLKLALIAEML